MPNKKQSILLNARIRQAQVTDYSIFKAGDLEIVKSVYKWTDTNELIYHIITIKQLGGKEHIVKLTPEEWNGK